MDFLDRKEKRRYIYNEESKDSFEKIYRYVEEGKQVLYIANDELTITDILTLYPICKFGFCSMRAIFAYNWILQKKEKMLALNLTTQQSLETSINRLVRLGLIVRCTYLVDGTRGNLFIATNKACSLVSKALDKVIRYEDWNVAAPIYKMIAGAASSYTAAALYSSNNFNCFNDGIVNFKKSGTTYLTAEANFTNSKGEQFVVGMYHAYLFYDKSRSTEDDYYFKVNKLYEMLADYFTYRTKKYAPRFVITVQDSDDFKKFIKYAISVDLLTDDMIKNIFITSENLLEYTFSTIPSPTMEWNMKFMGFNRNQDVFFVDPDFLS